MQLVQDMGTHLNIYATFLGVLGFGFVRRRWTLVGIVPQGLAFMVLDVLLNLPILSSH
jgi:hypothetical protein